LGEIQTCIVIDREVDFVTPLVTPLTYEGLIDEVLGIRNGFVKIDESLVAKESKEEENTETEKREKEKEMPPATYTNEPEKQIPIPLNSTDSLFSILRNQNIEKIGTYLQEQAKIIRESMNNFRDNKSSKSITEIHKFVKHLPSLTKDYKSLTQHINIAELIKQTTTSTAFRERWQIERAMIEGEVSMHHIIYNTKPKT